MILPHLNFFLSVLLFICLNCTSFFVFLGFFLNYLIFFLRKTVVIIVLFLFFFREWYSYHFPELYKIVPENFLYAKLASYIGNRKRLSEENLPELEEIVMDEVKANSILKASRSSMGLLTFIYFLWVSLNITMSKCKLAIWPFILSCLSLSCLGGYANKQAFSFIWSVYI